MDIEGRQRIIILGGGFGGLYAALRLEKTLARDPKVDILFSGFPAWWLWRTIYLSKLPRFEKKVRVALDWTLDLLFSKDLVQFVTLRAPTMSRPEVAKRPVDGAEANHVKGRAVAK